MSRNETFIHQETNTFLYTKTEKSENVSDEGLIDSKRLSSPMLTGFNEENYNSLQSSVTFEDFGKVAYQLLINSNEHENKFFKFHNSLITNIHQLYNNDNSEIISFDYLEFTFLSLLKKDGKKPKEFYKIITSIENTRELRWVKFESRLREFFKHNLVGLTQLVITNLTTKEETQRKEELNFLIEDKFNDDNINLLIETISSSLKLHLKVGNMDKSFILKQEHIDILFKDWDFVFEFVDLRNYFLSKY